MPRGRIPNDDRPAKVTINLPQSLYNQLVILFLDPMTKRAKYGALSNLATRLLKEWLDDQQRKQDVV